MARARKQPSVEERLEALEAAHEDPRSSETEALVARGIADKSWLVVARAAEIAGRLGLESQIAALTGVWSRFADGGPKLDPGCRAKDAALTALDRLEHTDPEPFLPATRYFQYEPVWGGKSETAGPLRVRAVSALLRMRYSEATLIAGELLAEPEREVRAGVAHALGYYALPGADALLAHRLSLPSEEPAVLAECAAGLLSSCPDYARARLVAWLDDESVQRREVASVALGQHEDPRSVAALIEWVDRAATEPDIEIGVQALGLSRQPRARAFLLELVQNGSRPRAEAAIGALAVHRYDGQLAARVRDAAAKSPHDGILERAEAAFAAASEPER